MRYLWLASIPLLTVGLWAEWQSFFDLWYNSIIYHHGFLVLGGVFFVLYKRKESLAALRVTGSPLGLFFLAGAVVGLILSQAADIRVFRLMLALLIILFWGWSIWGKGFLSIAGGPILLLIFAVPIWDDFSPLLQHITVFFNTILLQAFDIPATIHEFYIVLDVGTFLVENGCSGVRYLMVALFLATFYGQLYYRSKTRILLLVVIAGLLSMVANWIRVFSIIAAGHYTNMETSLIEDHELLGWVIFVIVTLVPLFFISTWLEQPSSSPTGDGTGQPQPETEQADTKSRAIKWPLIASLLLLVPPLIPAALDARTEHMASSWEPDLPEPDAGWSGPLRHADFWQPDYSKPDIDLSGMYVSDDLERVQMQITGYRRQAQDRELLGYRNQLFDRKEWKLVSRTTRTRNGSNTASPDTVSETVIQKNAGGAYVILWSWYQIGGQLTTSNIEVKIQGALNKLQGDARGALWALAGRCESASSEGETTPDCAGQRATFERFLNGAQR
ncbi:MAG: exosortase A [Marinobacter sp.]|uniref:exosortase A n=1 Tax=Marinobacter sp. TaxID=50741 RepID=UPI0032979669